MPLSAQTRAKSLGGVTKMYRTVAFWLVVRPAQTLRLICHKEYYKHASYFPESSAKRKSPAKVFFEQLGQIWKYGRINEFYFLYGFDVKSKAEQKEYLHYTPFIQRRGDLNMSMYYNYTCLLRDKFLFSIFCDGVGIKTPRIRFYSTDDKLFDYESKKEVGMDAVPQAGVNRLFCKPLDGACGRGIFILDVVDGGFVVDGQTVDRETLYQTLTKGHYIMQEFVVQHPEMSRLHPQSINTIRLVTVRGLKDGQIRVLPSILRIGTGQAVVDNTSQGGLAVGVELESGRLRQQAFYKPQFGLKATEHPDSHIRFSDFTIPYFDEVKRQAAYLHSLIPQIHSIGWDIAIGEDGPVFVEGNDNWEINGPQCCNGGMKRLFDEYFYR